ncbi:MAG TPA: hypothetical protein VMC80_03355 [Patescibacteria group bacterium]|nr:hypothetical protein [Patescibacteria group bacterium]
MFLSHEKTKLEDGKLVQIISDGTMRRFNVEVSDIGSAEVYYLFPTMRAEGRARDRYKQFIENHK